MKRFLGSSSFEIEIKRSIFIAQNFEVFSRDDVMTIVKSLKRDNPDATHICWAFVIGDSGELLGLSDDGEPSGTAGKPILSVIKGSGVTNTLITVTRFFGGTKLGTGGLVKAYQLATKELISNLEMEEIIEMKEFSFFCSYSQFNVLKSIFSRYSNINYDTDFKSEVFVRGELPLVSWNSFKGDVIDLTSGNVNFV